MGKNSSPDQLISLIRKLAEPVVSSFGLSIWGIELIPAGRMTVRIFLDSPEIGEASVNNAEAGILEGVSVDQCAEISRMLGLSLDVEEAFSNAWVLEVSSPGFDRSFFSLSQMGKYLTQSIDVTLISPHPNFKGRKKFKGPLQSVGEDDFVMKVLIPPAEGLTPEPANVSIKWALVKRAKLIPVFPESNKPGSVKSEPGGGK